MQEGSKNLRSKSKASDKSVRPTQASRSQVIRSKTSSLCNAGQHLVTKFFVIVESEHVVSAHRVLEFDMRSFLREDAPAHAEKGSENDVRFGAGPLTQAGMGRILIESGIWLDLSTSSATAYSARA